MLLEEAVMLSAPVAPKDRRHPGGAGAKRAVQGAWWRRQLPLRAFTLCPSPPSPIRPGGHPPPPQICSLLCCSPPIPRLQGDNTVDPTHWEEGVSNPGEAPFRQGWNWERWAPPKPSGKPWGGMLRGGGGGEGRAGPAQPGSCRQKAGRRQAGGRHEAGRRRCSPVPASRRCPAPVAVQRLRAAAGEEQAERGGSRAGDRDAFAFQETQQREIQSLRAEEKVSVSVSGSPVSSRAKE